MMGINRFDAAYLTTLLVEDAGVNRPLHGKVCFVFSGVGTPPIGLACIGFEHCLVRLVGSAV